MSSYPPPPAPEEKKSPPVGLIIGIIAAVLAVFVGLPVLACVGLIGFGVYRGREMAAELEREFADQQRREAEARQQEEAALLIRLNDILYPKAKEALALHWTEPEGVRSRRYADWQVRRLGQGRFEIRGVLQYSLKAGGRQTHRWSCEFSTLDEPPGARADWKLERVVVDDAQQFP